MKDANELDAVDALISAAMDDELDQAGREELERLIAADPAVAARVRAFHQIDSVVRGVGRNELEPEQLAAGYASIEERLGIGAGARPPLWRRPAFGLALAAAAVLFLYLSGASESARPGLAKGDAPPNVVVLDEPPGGAPDDLPSEEAPLEEESLDAFAVALGYAEGPDGVSPVPGLPMEDFEIIDQLELLEYLAAREAEGRG